MLAINSMTRTAGALERTAAPVTRPQIGIALPLTTAAQTSRSRAGMGAWLARAVIATGNLAGFLLLAPAVTLTRVFTRAHLEQTARAATTFPRGSPLGLIYIIRSRRRMRAAAAFITAERVAELVTPHLFFNPLAWLVIPTVLRAGMTAMAGMMTIRRALP